INARSEAFEEALSRAGFPYQVADSPFLRRPGPRSVVQRLRRSSRTDVAAAVEETAKALGYEEDGGEAEGDEATRQADLGRLVLMAKEFPPGGTVADFVADLGARFTEEEDGRGIQLLTYHRAKGKEYEAVFLPRLEEGELPFALAKSEERVAEERRLLYVGMTRAKQFLSLTWASSREGEKRSRPNPSPFLAEMGKGALPLPRQPARGLVESRTDGGSALIKALKRWRTETARDKELPAFVVFQDSTLVSIAEARPKTRNELLKVRGVGPAKLAEYADAILDLVTRYESDGGSSSRDG
ncbi:MAG: 3'-5' exonuclease, partial [Actinomycetota bacterium]